jgi:hypothetical protein
MYFTRLSVHYSLFIGIEKNNDDCRRIHLAKSNKWDAAKDVLLVSKRVETLSSLHRTPRMYQKLNAQYWDNDLKEKRAKLKRKMEDEKKQMDENIHSNDEQNVESMSPAELRAGLAQYGIKTRVKNVKRLQEMFRSCLH